jgi:site-specific DNA-methyltransferase (cytosine-N4-specific)
MRLDFYWHSYKYLPYERTLAHRELATLFGQQPTPWQHGLSIASSNGWASRAVRTTYFREVVAEDGQRIVPLQAVLEASAHGGQAESLPGIPGAPVLRRQRTRYSAHGIHEYRGKFNPQMARAIGNLVGLRPGDWVLDPFCGSGTTLLEAAHIGWNAVGVDINPLGVEITRAKLAARCISPAALVTYSSRLQQRLRQLTKGLTFDVAWNNEQLRRLGGPAWGSSLPNLDYLRDWFTESVLVQLSVLLTEINSIPLPEARLIFRVMLSDILREVSLQDPDDLRIRRRKSPPENAPVMPLFLDTMTSRVDTIVQARRLLSMPVASQSAILGDIRADVALVQRAYPRQQFDAAITSPPYVTALPYIDTQRLSLAVLGLIDAAAIRTTEKRLIGNREITEQERQRLEEALQSNADYLPQDCWRLCCSMRAAVDKSRDGFRRRNMPALTYQYCRDMARMFRQVRQLLRPNAPFVLVVGCNKTRLGGQEFLIDTPRLLTSLATQHGFRLNEALELNTYQRFDVHQANSIRSETLLILTTVPHADRSHTSD